MFSLLRDVRYHHERRTVPRTVLADGFDEHRGKVIASLPGRDDTRVAFAHSSCLQKPYPVAPSTKRLTVPVHLLDHHRQPLVLEPLATVRDDQRVVFDRARGQ